MKIRGGKDHAEGESNLESVMTIFSFEKKKDLERQGRDLVIRSGDFFALVLACELRGEPFASGSAYRGVR
jgi:hypothetical protein